jgi:hypothetical protein
LILDNPVPNTQHELRRFIGMINYSRDIWIHRSNFLEWTEAQQIAAATIYQIFSKDTLLPYPDFSQPFEIHTDRSLGTVISQDK